MSVAPQSLIEVRRYIAEKAGLPRSNMSIRAARSSHGFHAGKSEIFGPNGDGKKDYSVKDARNMLGLSEASSAIDIKLPQKTLRALTAFLVEAGKNGTAIFEVIGPDANGAATYYSVRTDWQPNHKLAPKSHEWHIHLGLYRDTEFTDRVAIFRPFFEAAPVPEPEPDPDVQPDPAPSLTDLEQALADLETANQKIAAAQAALA